MKYSIIIPTYNNFEECLKPCLKSVIDNTPGIGTEVEVIVVSNGCTDETDAYVRTMPDGVKLLSYPNPLGYTRAVNTGLGVATGEYVVLLNNDCKILEWGKDGKWLYMMHKPFEDPSVGITGPSKLYSEEIKDHFIIFFCCMIPRRLFFEIGYLDETFNPGGGEDIDFCMRLHKAGYRSVRVPADGLDWKYETNYPIYHAGEKTVHTMVDDWENKFQRRMQLLDERTKRGYYSDFADVTCEISTKGRFTSTLPMAILSVALQELKPKKLIIFQDDQSEFNMLESDIYIRLFMMLERAGIQWSVVFGENKGQVKNHQKALDIAETEWIWRLDDDNFAEADTLRLLMEETDDEVGAVAPSCIDPKMGKYGRWSTRMSDINSYNNVQWYAPMPEEDAVIPAEHLYSTFVYRKSAASDYHDGLSPVGHREETMFSHQIYLNGWKLLVVRNATVWHMRGSHGGIRSYTDPNFWAHDEQKFMEWCKKRNIQLKTVININLDAGIGDHYMFKMALPRIRENNPNTVFRVFACHPEVLADEPDLDILSIVEGQMMVQNFNDINPYAWCMKNNWKGSFVDALVKMNSK